MRLVAQDGADLGERMYYAASTFFEIVPELVLILGTDTSALPPGSIHRAARVLEDRPRGECFHDFAIVCRTDGGYVPIDLRETHEALFLGITRSTAAVCRKASQKARALGLFVHEGEPHYSVDIPEGFARLEEELKASPEADLPWRRL